MRLRNPRTLETLSKFLEPPSTMRNLSLFPKSETVVLTPMNPIFASGRVRRPGFRAMVWLILASLLLIQAKVAFGACLLTGAGAQAPITQLADSISVDPCADNNSPATLSCLTHCEQASESPRPNADTTQFLPFAFPAGPAPLAPIDPSPFVVHESPVAWADQSLYLRLHRLLT